MATASGTKGSHLALLGVIAVIAWALGFYFRMAPAEVRPSALPAESAAVGATAAAAANSSPTPLERTAQPTVTARTATSTPTASAPPPNDGTASAPAASGAPAASTTASAAASTTASAGASSAPAELDRCVAQLFPDDTFAERDPSFAFLCVEPYPQRGVTRLQAQIAKGKWGTSTATRGMQEWAALGWYQLAAYTLLRGRCCRSTEPYLWSFELSCPIDEALRKLETAARARDLPSIEATLKEYRHEANCLARRGQAPNFGQKRMPGSGFDALQRMLDRLE